MGDQPTEDGGAGDRDVPAGIRSPRRGEASGAQPVTVEQLLARQGSVPGRGAPGRRRAAGLAQATPDVRPDDFPSVRHGMPPVPGAEPPVAARAGLPPVPPAPGRPGRRSGPIPPLPRPKQAAGDRPQRRPARAERPPASAGRRGLLRVGTALALVLGLVVLYHLGLYFYVDQKITRVAALATDGPEILAPQLQAGTQNYLVVGTHVPGETGPASVATLLASVSATDNRAVLVSVPPTALVDTPMCRTPGGSLREPVTEPFAASLLRGGPSCMVRAVQELSGLRIDHYLAVDLRRLPGMVDALGGVPLCTVPSAATAAAATPPPPGLSTMSGTAAAGFLKPGDPRADVTGAAVAERSQRLLTSTLRAALSIGTVADPPRLARFLTRAANALTVDDQTTLGDLRALAGSLGGLSGNAVQRAGLPVAKVGYRPTGSTQSYVLLDSAGTRSLFDTVIGHTRLPSDGEPPPATTAPAAPAPPAVPVPRTPAPTGGAPTVSVPPASVTVDVLNGTGTTGLAGTVADDLRAQGFTVGTVGNETGSVTSSVVRYGPASAAQARTVAAAVPGAVLQASNSIGNAVQLVIGPGYSKVVPVTVGPPAAKATVTAPAAPSTTATAPVTC